MPVFAIDGVAPELPPEGEYWIAPDAVLIGRVRLKKTRQHMVGLGVARRQ